MTFAEKLKSLIDERDLSQVSIAETLGVAPARITEWKGGDGEPKLKYLARLARVLGVSVDYLVDDDRDEVGVDAVTLGPDELRVLAAARKRGLIESYDLIREDRPDPAVGSKVVVDATRGPGRLVRPASDASRAENQPGRPDPSLPQ